MTDLFSVQPTILQTSGGEVSCIFMSADRNRMAADPGTEIVVWQNNNGEWVLFCKLPQPGNRAVFVDERGRFLLSCYKNQVTHWDVDRQEQLFVFNGHTDTIWCFTLLPGTDLFSSSEDSTVRVWSLTHRTQLAVIPVPDSCYFVTVRPGGRHLAACGYRFLVIKDISACLASPAVLDVALITEVAKPANETSNTWSANYSPDGRLLATGSLDNTVKIYNADNDAYPLIRRLQGHTDCIYSVVFDTTNRYVFSGSADDAVKVWDVEEGRCVKTLTHHTGTVRSLNLSADGSLLVSGSEDGTVAIIRRGIDVEALFGDIKRDGD